MNLLDPNQTRTGTSISSAEMQLRRCKPHLMTTIRNVIGASLNQGENQNKFWSFVRLNKSENLGIPVAVLSTVQWSTTFQQFALEEEDYIYMHRNT